MFIVGVVVKCGVTCSTDQHMNFHYSWNLSFLLWITSVCVKMKRFTLVFHTPLAIDWIFLVVWAERRPGGKWETALVLRLEMSHDEKWSLFLFGLVVMWTKLYTDTMSIYPERVTFRSKGSSCVDISDVIASEILSKSVECQMFIQQECVKIFFYNSFWSKFQKATEY